MAGECGRYARATARSATVAFTRPSLQRLAVSEHPSVYIAGEVNILSMALRTWPMLGYPHKKKNLGLSQCNCPVCSVVSTDNSRAAAGMLL